MPQTSSAVRSKCLADDICPCVCIGRTNIEISSANLERHFAQGGGCQRPKCAIDLITADRENLHTATTKTDRNQTLGATNKSQTNSWSRRICCPSLLFDGNTNRIAFRPHACSWEKLQWSMCVTCDRASAQESFLVMSVFTLWSLHIRDK